MTPFSDEMLSAYLDGEADEALSARIEQAAGENEELAMRLERMAAGDGALRDAADALLGPTPPRLLAA
jgi:anti-sigma factor RsiW